MVKIRLTRGGAKKRPFYHIIVTDSRSARDGRNIERLGFYNPVATGAEKRVELDTERVQALGGPGRADDRQGRRCCQEGRPRPLRGLSLPGRACTRAAASHERSERRILLGRVHGAFGVRGEVKLESFTEPRDRDLPLPAVDPARRAGPRARARRRARPRDRQGPGRDASRRRRPRRRRSDARHRNLGAALARCRQPKPGEYYWVDLEGLRVVNRRRRRLRHRLAPVLHRRQRRAGGARASASA